MAAISFGAIVLLRNTAFSTYLDTYGWVANSPDFWNVAGTERIFVSTCAGQDRGGGTTSWQIVSADGTQEGQALRSGDRAPAQHVPDAGYLDCCGWVEDPACFATRRLRKARQRTQVRCGVFTRRANRDNGTGI